MYYVWLKLKREPGQPCGYYEQVKGRTWVEARRNTKHLFDAGKVRRIHRVDCSAPLESYVFNTTSFNRFPEREPKGTGDYAKGNIVFSNVRLGKRRSALKSK